ncbi:MAG: hypothetical protein GW949_06465 [Spirochaetales bacterium]|nr:hypothetical protein [Spirochaetales bacterium]
MILNGLIGVDTVQDWASLGIGHGFTLAVVLSGVLEHEKKAKPTKLLAYPKNVWGLTRGDRKITGKVAEEILLTRA